MPDHWFRVLENLPFMAASVSTTSPQLSKTRIIEALLIAVITAGGTTWGVVKVLEWRMQRVESDVAEIRVDVKEQGRTIDEIRRDMIRLKGQ